ncbi:hypothetical protein PR048_019222 [Dryococelus australis]|uniref:Uncharacterized protein n=1 Tax=Dryococelus australis TaxID=614101 RepID=A0ABQ9H2V9_9NEOP|nr:hypothetical protein PR048_019222 [Dryococelus australis]
MRLVSMSSPYPMVAAPPHQVETSVSQAVPLGDVTHVQQGLQQKFCCYSAARKAGLHNWFSTPLHSNVPYGYQVVKWLAYLPPTKVNQVQSPTGSPEFCKWESGRTMLLVDGFSWGSPVSPVFAFRHRSILTSITLIGSHDLVKSHPALSLSHPKDTKTKRRPMRVSVFRRGRKNNMKTENGMFRLFNGPLIACCRLIGRDMPGLVWNNFPFGVTERGGAVVTHWTRIREDPGSIPCPAILISVFHGFSKSLQANAGVGP